MKHRMDTGMVGRVLGLGLWALVAGIPLGVLAQTASSPSEETLAPTNGPILEIDGESSGLAKPLPDVPSIAESRKEWEIGWDQGLHYALNLKVSHDAYFPWMADQEYRSLHGRAGVKLHMDAATYSTHGDVPDIPSGLELRRGRVYTLGDTYFLRPMDYQLEFGFSGSEFFFSQGYLRWNTESWAKSIQVGQFKAPMSLEMLEGSGATTFLERGLPVLAFAPGSRFGLQVGGPFADDRMTYSLGYYANIATLDIGDATDRAVGPMGRLTYAPIHERRDGHTRLVHLGGSASYTISRSDSFQYRARPESYLAPFLVDTGELGTEDGVIYGLEAAAVSGPLSGQAEFLHATLTESGGKRVNFIGAYASASWFLTGESRPYVASRGVLTRVRPSRVFSIRDRTWGAWEVAGRLSAVDLTDGLVQGGRMWDLTSGLNWYWARDSRMMFNYVYSRVDQGTEEGHVHTFQTRLQLEF